MIKNNTRVNLAVAAALAILISACSIANLGWLRNSQDVGQAFETLHVSAATATITAEETEYGVLS
jgi:hypothetical protein